MVAWLEFELRYLAPTSDFDIGGLVLAGGNILGWQIRHFQQPVALLVPHLPELRFHPVEFAAECRDLVQQGLDILALRLGLADGLGAGVALVLQLLQALLERLAPGFKCLERGHVETVATGLETFRDARGFSSQQLGIEHRSVSQRQQRHFSAPCK